MSSSVGCIFFFLNELVWVQIGPKPDFFFPLKFPEDWKVSDSWVSGCSWLPISAGGSRAMVRDMWGAQGLQPELSMPWISSQTSPTSPPLRQHPPSSWLPPRWGKVLLLCRKRSGETCPRIWGKTLETELFRAVADN